MVAVLTLGARRREAEWDGRAGGCNSTPFSQFLDTPGACFAFGKGVDTKLAPQREVSPASSEPLLVENQDGAGCKSMLELWSLGSEWQQGAWQHQ